MTQRRTDANPFLPKSPGSAFFIASQPSARIRTQPASSRTEIRGEAQPRPLIPRIGKTSNPRTEGRQKPGPSSRTCTVETGICRGKMGIWTRLEGIGIFYGNDGGGKSWLEAQRMRLQRCRYCQSQAAAVRLPMEPLFVLLGAEGRKDFHSEVVE